MSDGQDIDVPQETASVTVSVIFEKDGRYYGVEDSKWCERPAPVKDMESYVIADRACCFDRQVIQ